MRSLAEARIKRSQAVELLAEGCSYDEIARQVGFTNRGSAHRAVSKALSERQAENIDYLRALEGDRLDRLQSAMWERAMTGDVRAVHAVSRIISQRIRLFGLDQYDPGHFDATPQVLVVGPAEGNPGEATEASLPAPPGTGGLDDHDGRPDHGDPRFGSQMPSSPAL